MHTADGCTVVYVRIGGPKSIYTRSREHFDEPDGRCGDCNAKHGELHHMGCDVERCPKCDGQLISCDCKADLDFERRVGCPHCGLPVPMPQDWDGKDMDEALCDSCYARQERHQEEENQ